MSRSYQCKLARREFIASNMYKPPSDLARPSSAGVGVLHYDSSDMVLEDGLGHARQDSAFPFEGPLQTPILTMPEDWAHHRHLDTPQHPTPLRLGQQVGFGYRKPESVVSPHWSQWPAAPHQPARPTSQSRDHCLSPRPPYWPRNAGSPTNCEIRAWTAPVNSTHMTAMLSSDNRHVIMNRGLSPRRQAPPPLPPTRSLTYYGTFGNREAPNPHIGGLDLHASPYNANRGFNQGITSYSSRQSRPLHRHLPRKAKGDDYCHDQSVFFSTTPNVTGYFVIHPDWVSERSTLRRSQSLLGI